VESGAYPATHHVVPIDDSEFGRFMAAIES